MTEGCNYEMNVTSKKRVLSNACAYACAPNPRALACASPTLIATINIRKGLGIRESGASVAIESINKNKLKDMAELVILSNMFSYSR